MQASTRFIPLALLLLIPFLTSCGDDGGGEIQVPPLTQTEADDVAQLAGIVTGTNQGGWLAVLDATTQSMPLAPGRFSGSMSARGPVFQFASSPSPGIGTTRDTSIIRSGVTFNITYLYSDTASTDSIDTWNPDVRQVDFWSTGSGTIQASSDSGGYTHTGQGAGFGLFEAGGATDTLNLDGTIGDSLLTRIARFASPTTIKYYNVTFFGDYDLDWYRQYNPQFPIGGTATISVLAEELNSLNPADRADDLVDAEITITFDGTQTPLIGITNDSNNPTPQFRYRMNLRTGVVTRFP